MAIFETFTKRQKQLEKAGKEDVYQYDELPVAFRVQVIHIWDDAIGVYGSVQGRPSPANRFWSMIQSTLARELGVFALTGAPAGHVEQCKKYLLEADTAGALDIIELSFRVIDGGIRQFGPV